VWVLCVLFIEFDIITLLGILLLHKMFVCSFCFLWKSSELSKMGKGRWSKKERKERKRESGASRWKKDGHIIRCLAPLMISFVRHHECRFVLLLLSYFLLTSSTFRPPDSPASEAFLVLVISGFAL